MAIARDAFTNGSYTTATSLTYSHTCTGSDRLLFVGEYDAGGSSKVTGVTYSGAAMTQIGSAVQAGTGRFHTLWYKIAPATGANNVVVTLSSSDFIASGAASYTGCDQTNQPDANASTSSSSATALSQAVTTIADNCWVIGSGHSSSGAASITAGTGESLVGTWGFIATAGFIDTNAAVTPAGSRTMDMNMGIADSCALIVASFRPPGAVVAVVTRSFTLLGVGA